MSLAVAGVNQKYPEVVVAYASISSGLFFSFFVLPLREARRVNITGKFYARRVIDKAKNDGRRAVAMKKSNRDESGRYI
ncbi:hypothetical protein ES707_08076 [subsurface metagenome]